jgi:hypothetical protein
MRRSVGRFPLPLLKVVLLASAGIAGSTWALVRHYTRPLPPMVVTVPLRPATASAASDDGGALYEISGTETVR